ncbi:hypothetical protein XAXN_01395 [Xanthomonas axonopodis]|uniref:Uncharacterized protein n=1 Tax=Xanthomonas axonopodis TaxID=53413 RepID=A0A0N8GE37_9XANT|nr:hypothetical protein [Xanthomonas axonopodis]KPL50433.1 hypothetical protein XAXN_01395 [Xanthomonas axonopodis]
MPTLAAHQQQLALLEQLRASRDPQVQQQAEQLHTFYHDRKMAGLADDVYDSAKGEGQPGTGWIHASEHLDKLREYAPQLNMTDDQIRDFLKPDSSGFRAEIYLPDPVAPGPGYSTHRPSAWRRPPARARLRPSVASRKALVALTAS